MFHIEYNEKSRLGTTYPDELFKNAVAAVYKAAAAATQPLFLFFCLFVYTTFFYYYYYYYVYATYVKIYRCRVESTSGVVKRTVFSLHKEVGTPYTYTACTVVHYSVRILHTHTHIYIYICVCVCVCHGCAKYLVFKKL
jgi:hypothetical protein